MAIRTLLLAMLLSVAPWVAAAEGVPKQIHLVSEEWLDYTNADGTGVAWDVLRKVFEPAGVKVVPQSAPYSRAVGLVKRGEADAWVGSYKQENADNLYPRWHFDMDHIYALGLASKPAPTAQNVASIAWPGCAATTTAATCQMCMNTVKFSVAKAFCRCSSMTGWTSTSMHRPKSIMS